MREAVLYIHRGFSVMGQLVLRLAVLPEVIAFQPLFLPPADAVFDPFPVPFFIRAGQYEKFHFHLFEFPDAEYEISGRYLVAERLADLRNAERKLAGCRV